MYLRPLRKLRNAAGWHPLALFGIWWLILQVFAAMAAERVDLVLPDRAYAWITVTDVSKILDWPGWIALHVRWDSGFFLWIAQAGYQHDNAAFLPLYPLCIRAATFGWSLLTGAAPTDLTYAALAVLISNVSALGAALSLYELARLDLDETGARHALFCFLIFPTAFVLTTVYTEPLFMACAALSFYCARRQNWWLAGVAGLCAALTRVTGLWLFPALLVEWWSVRRKYRWGWVAFLLIPLAFLGFEGFLRLQGLSFFATQQDVFQRWPLAPGALWANLDWGYARLHSAALAQHLLELGIGLIVLALSLAAGKELRLSYAVFGGLCIAGPIMTGHLVSIERYALMAFPAFLVLGRNWRSVWVEYGYTLGAILLLALYTLMFVQGYWAG